MTESNHDKGAKATGAPTSSFSLERYHRASLENVRKQLREAARQLKAAGVTFVHIEYDGCGDSGSIDTIDYLDASHKPIDPTGRLTLLDDQLRNLFYDLTQARHGGWEINDGGFGQFDWQLDTDALLHIHHDRFTDHDTTEHAGL